MPWRSLSGLWDGTGRGRSDRISVRFGPAGQAENYKGKSSVKYPAWLAERGLNAFEYQCGHGVRLAEDKARKMAALAAEKGGVFSVHAPYYISMSSLDEEKRLGSIRYLLQSCALCRALGGQRVIFHPGSCGKQSRAAALEKALDISVGKGCKGHLTAQAQLAAQCFSSQFQYTPYR